MAERAISVSTVAYDGHPLDVAFAEIARLGFSWVEPAFIKGYMDFGEDDLEEKAASAMRGRLAVHGLGSVAISAHMDQGAAGAAEALARRVRFAAAIGARIAITNSTTRAHRNDLSRVLEHCLPIAEGAGVVIALENPGHGSDDLMPDGAKGAELVRSFASAHLRLNYDGCNALTYRDGATRPEDDIDATFSALCHAHLKDAVRGGESWRYVAIGEGEIDYRRLLAKLAERRDVPLAIELPLRLQRDFGQNPVRARPPPSLTEIARVIERSLQTCKAQIGGLGSQRVE